MDTAGDSEEDKLSSVRDSEEETAQQEVGRSTDTILVGEIVKAFSTLAFCNVS